ncbi:M23 family metallopeptidase [Brevibacillus sp. SYP-B805]|uniref:M23 family metallopeptidase n=1 Tax=Brevibacillus sp. SYP-B805 TaxID=1578199 RepID=UPI0013EBCF70|nr:M23 family metallopeptidase [Brevibacillus sp. SYP-B805]NGQ95580.1 M23 family metallopeptidase [Brevibacillus sp. SYP-B805]
MEENKNSNQPIPFRKTNAWKSFLGKKWAFPAIYIGTAAIILAIVMWYQNSLMNTAVDPSQTTNDVTVTQPGPETPAPETDKEEAVPASGTTPQLAWPVAQGVTYQKGMAFFDDQLPKEEQQKALVKYDNTFIPHTGIDIVSTDGKAFDVTAALSGKVLTVENDPLAGYLVEIEHTDKMVTVYQSLDKVLVKPGDEVTQGQKIGTAGRNEYEKDAGIHLHFEVRVDGNSVNPEQYLTSAEAKTQ